MHVCRASSLSLHTVPQLQYLREYLKDPWKRYSGCYSRACRSLLRHLLPAWAENLCQIPTTEPLVYRKEMYQLRVTALTVHSSVSHSFLFTLQHALLSSKLSRLKI